MKTALIFDLDGTLIDTPQGIVDTFIAALGVMDIAAPERTEIHATIGMPLEKAFSKFLGKDAGEDVVRFAVKQYQRLFQDIVLPRAVELTFAGVTDGLALLKNQGYALAVATSKVYKSAEALLKAAELFDYFDIVVGSDQVMNPKPHPEMGHLVMRMLDVTPERSIMIGDTTHDLLMAKDSGMQSIAVTYGVHDLKQLESAKPTWIFDSFNEVIQCINTVPKSRITTEYIEG